MLPDTWRAVELPITPSERSIRARIGAYSLHSQVDGRTITSAARRAATESLNDRLLDQIDPDHVLTDAERARRLDYARSAHFQKLALKSA